MSIFRNSSLVLVFLIVTGNVVGAYGQAPMEAVRDNIEKALTILNDPRYEGAEQAGAQREKLWGVLKEIFNFREFSRRVLAGHWKKFTPIQREEFTDVFGKFLGKFYLSRLQKYYTDERAVYLEQQFSTVKKATVKIGVIWKNQEIPVEIRMIERHGHWKAYDLLAFGISAVRNYRAQFDEILRKATPDQVIAQLEERIKNL